MVLKLLSPEGDVRAEKVLVAASFGGVKIDKAPFVVGKDDKTAAFLAKSPLGRTPVLETPEGALFESNAICRYVSRVKPEAKLYGANLFESSQVDMWTDFNTFELEIPVCCLVQGKATKKAKEDIKMALTALDNHLLKHTYMVGERPSVADVCIAVTVMYGVNSGKLEASFMKAFPNFQRFLDTITNKREYKKALEAPKKAAKTNGNTEAKDDACDEEEEEETKKPEKVKNPLDDLPPTSLVLDAWKREYSNTKDYDQSMKWFWDNLDKQGWSIWQMKYDKVEGECNIGFVTSNQLGGFLQRMDSAFRKYSFGVNHVVGSDSNFDIVGVWMVRGLEMPNEVIEHPSYEYHTWTKLNPDDEKAKKLVNEYWTSTDTVEGLPIFSSTVWK